MTDVHTDAELISPYHLRRALYLKDGDTIDFTLAH
jgi:CTP-dependent riboflavin kinase